MRVAGSSMSPSSPANAQLSMADRACSCINPTLMDAQTVACVHMRAGDDWQAAVCSQEAREGHSRRAARQVAQPCSGRMSSHIKDQQHSRGAASQTRPGDCSGQQKVTPQPWRGRRAGLFAASHDSFCALPCRDVGLPHMCPYLVQYLCFLTSKLEKDVLQHGARPQRCKGFQQ